MQRETPTRSATPTRARRRRSRSAPRSSRGTARRRRHRSGGATSGAATSGSRPIVDFLGDVEGTATAARRRSLSIVDTRCGVRRRHGYHRAASVAIVDGTGAGQIRPIAVPNATTLAGRRRLDDARPTRRRMYVAVRAGNDDHGRGARQRGLAGGVDHGPRLRAPPAGRDVLDIRAAIRLIPSTHNFPAADNLAFNGIGTASGHGNIALLLVRLLAQARRRRAAPAARRHRSEPARRRRAARCDTATRDDAPRRRAPFAGLDLRAPAPNYRYHLTRPSRAASTSSRSRAAPARSRRAASPQHGDVLTLEAPWGVVPAPGDTFEVYAIVAMPEAINPSEGYHRQLEQQGRDRRRGSTASAATVPPHLHPRAARGRERLGPRQAAPAEQGRRRARGPRRPRPLPHAAPPRGGRRASATAACAEVDTVLAQLEAFEAPPRLGRRFIDPVATRRSPARSRS